MSILTNPIVTHLVFGAITGAIGYWIGKKGAAAVAGDVKIATQDVKQKL